MVIFTLFSNLEKQIESLKQKAVNDEKVKNLEDKKDVLIKELKVRIQNSNLVFSSTGFEIFEQRKL